MIHDDTLYQWNYNPLLYLACVTPHPCLHPFSTNRSVLLTRYSHQPFANVRQVAVYTKPMGHTEIDQLLDLHCFPRANLWEDSLLPRVYSGITGGAGGAGGGAEGAEGGGGIGGARGGRGAGSIGGAEDVQSLGDAILNFPQGFPPVDIAAMADDVVATVADRERQQQFAVADNGMHNSVWGGARGGTTLQQGAHGGDAESKAGGGGGEGEGGGGEESGPRGPIYIIGTPSQFVLQQPGGLSRPLPRTASTSSSSASSSSASSSASPSQSSSLQTIYAQPSNTAGVTGPDVPQYPCKMCCIARLFPTALYHTTTRCFVFTSILQTPICPIVASLHDEALSQSFFPQNTSIEFLRTPDVIDCKCIHSLFLLASSLTSLTVLRFRHGTFHPFARLQSHQRTRQRGERSCISGTKYARRHPVQGGQGGEEQLFQHAWSGTRADDQIRSHQRRQGGRYSVLRRWRESREVFCFRFIFRRWREPFAFLALSFVVFLFQI